jgi:hypothetical protein
VTSKVRHWLAVLLLMAVAVRIADWLLRPVLSLLPALLGLLVLYGWLFGRSYR